jgi:hypothetical protein
VLVLRRAEGRNGSKIMLVQMRDGDLLDLMSRDPCQWVVPVIGRLGEDDRIVPPDPMVAHRLDSTVGRHRHSELVKQSYREPLAGLEMVNCGPQEASLMTEMTDMRQ